MMFFWVSASLILMLVFSHIWHPSYQARISIGSRLVLSITVMACAIGVYLLEGKPYLPDHPLAVLEKIAHPAAQQNENASLDYLLKHAQKTPDDANSWAALGNAYETAHAFYKSALHYREAWRCDPQNMALKILYARSIILAHNGHCPKSAQVLLKELKKQNPQHRIIKKLWGLCKKQRG